MCGLMNMVLRRLRTHCRSGLIEFRDECQHESSGAQFEASRGGRIQDSVEREGTTNFNQL